MDQDIRRWIRDIPDFPEKGILFRDITPALLDPVPFKIICDSLAAASQSAVWPVPPGRVG